MATEKKKGFFERIGDLFSNRDELAKEAEAKKKAAELAEQQRQAIKAQADKQAAELAKAREEAAATAEKVEPLVPSFRTRYSMPNTSASSNEA